VSPGSRTFVLKGRRQRSRNPARLASLVERSRDKVDAYVGELKKWEQDPDVYAHNTVLTQRIENAFQQMLQSFVNS
jgi:hypothetical protein